MSDLELIILLVAGFTLYEASRGMRWDAVLFASTWRPGLWLRDHRLRGMQLRNGRGAALGSLSPAGACVVADPWPVTMTATGVSLRPAHTIAPYRPPPTSCEEIPWEALEVKSHHDMTVTLTDGQTLTTSSKSAAHWWAARLRELALCPPADRAAVIRETLAATLDTTEIARRHADFFAATRYLRPPATALFLFMFVALPLVLPLSRLQIVPPITYVHLALIYLGLALWAQLEVYFAHREVFPASVGERVLTTLLVPIYPAGAIQARPGLAREALGRFHPLALACALSPRDEQERLARRVLQGLRYPPADSVPAAEAQELLLDLLHANGLDPETLLAPPAPGDSTSHSYCPYCDDQLQAESGACPDCETVQLVPLQSSGSR